jgi:hypothetical protein
LRPPSESATTSTAAGSAGGCKSAATVPNSTLDRSAGSHALAAAGQCERWASRWRWPAFPGKIWVVSHKPLAVAAGLGHMGIHRNVIHPKFGNFILLGTRDEGRCRGCVAIGPIFFIYRNAE